ncbi:MAG: DinB family protein [Acidobacteriota bacterium]
MEIERIVIELEVNKDIFRGFFTGMTEEEYLWKSSPEKWCLLEILCHLYDEEREDFRARARHILEHPQSPFIGIDPKKWVSERKYIKQDYEDKLDDFLKERNDSITWLRSLEDPQWNNIYDHPVFGKMTAKTFLTNWLAHDYLHLRQILGLKFNYHKEVSTESLAYAGEW